MSALQLELERSEVHILHFIGHGGYDEGTGDGTLMFEDEQGRGRKVPGSTLATLLNDHDPLRLLVLNACEGARSGVEDPFAGVALSVVRRGAPAVIAMQFEITDTAALTFANHFYLAVANGLPIDAACTAARKAVFAEDNQVEWATPVLYMRAPDGVVFQITEDPALPSATSPPPQPVASAAAPLAADTAPVKPAEPDRSPAPRRRLPLAAAGLGALAAVAAVVVAGALLGGGDDPVDPTTPPTPEPNVVIASTLDVDPGPTRAAWALEADGVVSRCWSRRGQILARHGTGVGGTGSGRLSPGRVPDLPADPGDRRRDQADHPAGRRRRSGERDARRMERHDRLVASRGGRIRAWRASTAPLLRSPTA